MITQKPSQEDKNKPKSRTGSPSWQPAPAGTGKPTLIPVVQLSAVANKTKRTSSTAPLSLGLSHRMRKREERSAWAKTPEGQTGQGSLGLKSILVSGSLKVIANSRGKSMGRPPSNRVASSACRCHIRAEPEKVSEKLTESHARAVLLQCRKPKKEPRTPPSKTRNELELVIVIVRELGDGQSFLTPGAVLCPLSQTAQPQ